MSKLNRRKFLKLLGQGSAALGVGMGLSGRFSNEWGSAWAADKQVKQAADTWDWDAWEFYYPGKYDAADTQVLNDHKVELDKINKSSTNIKGMISSKLAEKSEGRGEGPGGGAPGGGAITYDGMINSRELHYYMIMN